MQFAYIIDKKTGIEHTYMILSLGKDEFEDIKEMCSKHIPFITCCAVLRKGHPYIVVDYGFGGTLKATIPLDDKFDSGDLLGDKFNVGDVATVILTDKPQDKVIDLKKKDVFNVTLDEIIAYSFVYTVEMQEIYDLYCYYQEMKDNKKKR
jgi:hypothetical protein